MRPLAGKSDPLLHPANESSDGCDVTELSTKGRLAWLNGHATPRAETSPGASPELLLLALARRCMPGGGVGAWRVVEFLSSLPMLLSRGSDVAARRIRST